MNFPHDIIRDAWAVRHGGRTEVPVGQDRIDIVVDGAQYDTLVEVKPADQVREAIGQGRLGVELQVVRFDSNTFTLSSQTAAVDWLRQANYRTVYGGSR
jgi:hypothetical protein